MVVLDISLPTGFVPENEDLEMVLEPTLKGQFTPITKLHLGFLTLSAVYGQVMTETLLWFYLPALVLSPWHCFQILTF
jgi:hypothetical protein